MEGPLDRHSNGCSLQGWVPPHHPGSLAARAHPSQRKGACVQASVMARKPMPIKMCKYATYPRTCAHAQAYWRREKVEEAPDSARAAAALGLLREVGLSDAELPRVVKVGVTYSSLIGDVGTACCEHGSNSLLRSYDDTSVAVVWRRLCHVWRGMTGDGQDHKWGAGSVPGVAGAGGAEKGWTEGLRGLRKLRLGCGGPCTLRALPARCVRLPLPLAQSCAGRP
jgi:hypothetical protein